MNMESKSRLSKSDVMKEIEGIRGQIFQSGSVDAEKDVIGVVLGRLDRNEISSVEALKQVRELEQSRQDYH